MEDTCDRYDMGRSGRYGIGSLGRGHRVPIDTDYGPCMVDLFQASHTYYIGSVG